MGAHQLHFYFNCCDIENQFDMMFYLSKLLGILFAIDSFLWMHD